jgi:hypothetical protein
MFRPTIVSRVNTTNAAITAISSQIAKGRPSSVPVPSRRRPSPTIGIELPLFIR